MSMEQPPRKPTSPENVAAAIQEIENSLPLRMIQRKVDQMDMSADAKALTMDIARMTVKVGNQLVAIGRKILTTVIELAKQFPMTSFGLGLGVAITTLIGTVPVLGPFLSPIVGPLLISFGLTIGAVQDYANNFYRASIRDLTDKVAIIAQAMPTT